MTGEPQDAGGAGTGGAASTGGAGGGGGGTGGVKATGGAGAAAAGGSTGGAPQTGTGGTGAGGVHGTGGSTSQTGGGGGGGAAATGGTSGTFPTCASLGWSFDSATACTAGGNQSYYGALPCLQGCVNHTGLYYATQDCTDATVDPGANSLCVVDCSICK